MSLHDKTQLSFVTRNGIMFYMSRNHPVKSRQIEFLNENGRKNKKRQKKRRRKSTLCLLSANSYQLFWMSDSMDTNTNAYETFRWWIRRSMGVCVWHKFVLSVDVRCLLLPLEDFFIPTPAIAKHVKYIFTIASPPHHLPLSHLLLLLLFSSMPSCPKELPKAHFSTFKWHLFYEL